MGLPRERKHRARDTGKVLTVGWLIVLRIYFFIADTVKTSESRGNIMAQKGHLPSIGAVDNEAWLVPVHATLEPGARGYCFGQSKKKKNTLFYY